MAKTPAAPASAPVEVLFVMLPGTLALDWAGPAEAFRLANQSLARLGQPARFALRHIGPSVAAGSSVGLQWAGLAPLPAQLGGAGVEASWVVLMGRPDEAGHEGLAEQNAVTHWLRGISSQLHGPHRLITICAGALLAAKAGLLAHTKVTTHHSELEALRALEPLCEVQANRVFAIDAARRVYSSAGITTGIDLAVHLIAEVCGEAVAARVAQVMVMPLRRGPADPAASPFLAYRNHMHPALHRVQDAVGADPRADWSASRMAGVAHTSPRHLARLFVAHAGIAPLHYLRRIRLASAQTALASGLNVTQAAEAAGFASDTQLRRAWAQFALPGTPSTVALLQKE